MIGNNFVFFFCPQVSDMETCTAPQTFLNLLQVSAGGYRSVQMSVVYFVNIMVRMPVPVGMPVRKFLGVFWSAYMSGDNYM